MSWLLGISLFKWRRKNSISKLRMHIFLILNILVFRNFGRNPVEKKHEVEFAWPILRFFFSSGSATTLYALIAPDWMTNVGE